MSTQNDVRERVIGGQASPDEALSFVEDLERALETALSGVDRLSAEAVSANERLARHKDAAAHLTTSLARIAGEDDRMMRLTMARELIDQHQAIAGE